MVAMSASDREVCVCVECVRERESGGGGGVKTKIFRGSRI